jgi:hypothetical protein
LVGRSGVRRLPGLSPSPSPGSGGAEFAVFRGWARVRALGRAERSFLWCPRPGLAACQPHSVKWHSSRSGAGGAVLLSGRSVERRNDCGHFGSVDWRTCVGIKVSGHLCIKCPCDLVGWRDDLARVASWRRLSLRRAGSMFIAGGGPRARRRSSGVSCPCPRLSSGEAWSSPSNGPIPDLVAPIRPLQLCADGDYQLRIRSLKVPLIMISDSCQLQTSITSEDLQSLFWLFGHLLISHDGSNNMYKFYVNYERDLFYEQIYFCFVIWRNVQYINCTSWWVIQIRSWKPFHLN